MALGNYVSSIITFSLTFAIFSFDWLRIDYLVPLDDVSDISIFFFFMNNIMVKMTSD